MAIPPLSASPPPTVIVDRYVPAPGQFVNLLPLYEAGDTAERMAEKCTLALASGDMITLGAWGGSITFHLEHPVVNVTGQRDLYLMGNAYAGSSEPGIVQVSVDANGNGLPDDAWYEISGSADADSTAALLPDAEGWARMQYGYELSYFRPDTLADVPWEDGSGRRGYIVRNAFHQQDYYPLWQADTLTMYGTLLPPNASDLSGQGSYWLSEAFRYGYVDNVANNDTLGCSIDLSWAVDPISRQPVQLTHADFFRIYCAELQQCGWLGETSTEFCGATDLHPEASLAFESGLPFIEEKPEDKPVAAFPLLPVGFHIVGRKLRVIH